MHLKKLYSDLTQNKPIREEEAYLPVENDQALWDAFRHGDETAFITIYKRYFRSLYRYASQYDANSAFIEDCVQDLFVEIRERRHRLSPTTSIKAYLFRSLKNLVLYRVKRRKKFFERYLRQSHQFKCTLSAEDRHIQMQQEKHTVEKLNQCLEQLSDRQKEAIYYYYFENFSYEQIRDIMGMHQIRSARNLIYRALAALRKSF